MDAGAFRHLGSVISGLFWFAVIGIAATAIAAIGAVVGLIWLAINHLQWV